MTFDLEKEVRDLAARRDIAQAVKDYMRGQDRLDWDLQRSAFHDDADLDCGLYRGGPDGYTDFAQGILADFKGSQHIIGQIDIALVDDTRANGEVYFFAWHRITEDGEDKDLLMAGRYVDEYECREGAWKILRRREIVDWARTDPVTDHFIRDETSINLAGRRGADFSDTRDWSSGTSGR